MPILAEQVEIVIGVDTHTDTYTAALLTSIGAVRAELTAPADPGGVDALLAWADTHSADTVRAWVVDGARSHGVGLTRRLRAAGERVLEAARVPGARRRRGGKSDPLDAILVARTALAADKPPGTPRADGDREALRLLHVARRHYTDTRTATVNVIKSLILTADDDLREQLRGLSTDRQIRHLTHLTPGTTGPTVDRIRREHLHTLATQVAALDRLITDNLKHLRTVVRALCPALLDQPGVGPVTAAIALTAWSHRGRLRSEAAFAALAGVNPIPASSGRTTRHRLNRGGDRTLNSALHTIARTRSRCHPTTQAYIARRTAQGRTNNEINRCLKRYIARQLFRLLQATP